MKTHILLLIFLYFCFSAFATPQYDFYIACLNGDEKNIRELVKNKTIQENRQLSNNEYVLFCDEYLRKNGFSFASETEKKLFYTHFNPTPLQLSVEAGNIEAVKILIKEKLLDLNSFSILNLHANKNYSRSYNQFIYNVTPLLTALHLKNEEMANLLIDSGEIVAIEDSAKNTPLYLAAVNNFTATVQKIVNDEDVVIDENPQWLNVIESLFSKKDTNSINALLKVKLAQKFPISLLYAIINNDISLIKNILKANVDVDYVPPKENMNALMGAIYLKNLEIVQILVENKANINYKTKNGTTPLFYAIENYSKPILQFLLDSGANPNILFSEYNNDESFTPITYTVNKNNTNSNEIIHMLLKAKADINLSDEFGKKPIHYAVDTNSINMLKLLVNAKADINAKDKQSNSPIMISAKNANTQSTQYLIYKQADLNAKNKENKTVFDVASSSIKQILEANLDFAKNQNLDYKKLRLNEYPKERLFNVWFYVDSIKNENIFTVSCFFKQNEKSKYNELSDFKIKTKERPVFLKGENVNAILIFKGLEIQSNKEEIPIFELLEIIK